jgi:hypothetical protein
MTKGRAVTWVSTKLGGVGLGLALGLATACGQIGERESGETHFVRCQTDDDCASLRGDYSCRAGLCQSAAEQTNPEPRVAPCESGCPGASCAIQGACGLDTTCALVGCNTASIDADGCYRPSCEQDDDCDADSRCTADYRMTRIDCVDDGPKTACGCTNGLGLNPIKVCSPSSLAGPRGSWIGLVVTENVIGSITRWTVTPAGAITTEHEPPNDAPPDATVQLDGSDLDELNRLIDGPALRHALQDPNECPLTKSKDDVVELMLDTTKLEKNVAGCLGGSAEVGAFVSLRDLLGKY